VMQEFNIDYYGIPLTVTAKINETKDHLGTGDSATEIEAEIEKITARDSDIDIQLLFEREICLIQSKVVENYMGY